MANMKNYDLLVEKKDLVKSEIYKKIKEYQLEMIIDMARTGYEPVEIVGMLRLIGKTDDWEEKFDKTKKKGE